MTKIHILPKNNGTLRFPGRTRLFHYTPCFSPDPVFSTPRVFHTPCFPHPVFSTRPRVFHTPGPRIPGPRPRVFHLARKKNVICQPRAGPCARGQHFQAQGHSFSLYRPPSRQITYIYCMAIKALEIRLDSPAFEVVLRIIL